MTQSIEAVSIPWHQLLGKLLELTLTPVDIQVETEVQVTSEPPKLDILLLRRKTTHWTPEQRALLPDGIRESSGAHQLLEFKYSESVNEECLAQAVAYEYFYRTTRRLKSRDAQIWLISSRTPRASRLQSWGYEKSDLPGVYRSRYVLVNRVGLLVLNQLSAEHHNAFIKVFASRQEEKDVAFRQAGKPGDLEPKVLSFLRGLREVTEVEEDDTMTFVVTPEWVIRRGEELTRVVLEMLTTEERLAGLKPEERIAGLKPEERIAGLKPEERIAGLKPEERIAGLKPEELLSLVSFDEIEAYLEEHRPKTDTHEQATD